MRYTKTTCYKLHERVAKELDHALTKCERLAQEVEKKEKKRGWEVVGMCSEPLGAHRAKFGTTMINASHLRLVGGMGLDAAAIDHSKGAPEKARKPSSGVIVTHFGLFARLKSWS